MMFILFGAGFALKGASYSIGTAADIGLGFVPVWLGIILAMLGILILAKSFMETYCEPRILTFNWRLLLLFIGALIFTKWFPNALVYFFFRTGPPGSFSLFVFYLAIWAALASGSLTKAMAMIVLGLLLSTVGTDAHTAQERFVFGIEHLAHGINVSSVLVGAVGIGLWAKLPKSPYRVGLLVLLAAYGCLIYWQLGYDAFFLISTILFGLAGYLWTKLKCVSAPLLFALTVGPQMEENFRRAMMLSRGNVAIFVSRPWSAAFLALALIALILAVVTAVLSKTKKIPLELGKA